MNHEPESPLFAFALSPDTPEMSPEDDIWSTPLPASRHDFNRANVGDSSGMALTYGDYFTAAQRFLAQDDLALICDAAGKLSGMTVAPADVKHISIFLVKHGAFYHPSYVVADVSNRRLPFVLNAACSRAGQEIISREYGSLSRLGTELPAPFWPRVFGIGSGQDLDGRRIPMFLGQWLEGFYEFHLTDDASSKDGVVVWDTRKGHHVLGRDAVHECMRQAARILAFAYNPITFEAVRGWHHAAGDFIVSVNQEGAVALRLITVRNYAPMIDEAEPDTALILDALVMYLLEISLRLRLDRRDGTGEMAVYTPDVVPAICHGFYQGLKMAASALGLPDDFDVSVKDYIALHGAGELMPIASAIIEKGAFQMEERDLLRHNLELHVSTLASMVCG